MREVFVLGAVRTPIGDLNGALAGLGAARLGALAARESLRRSGRSSSEVEEAIFGNVLQAGQGMNPARQAAVEAGVPVEAPAYTVNMVCGSGMKAIALGWQSILLGRARVVLAGGFESMSQAPYLLPAMRGGARLGHAQAADSLLADGLTDVFTRQLMGGTADAVARQFGISREEQDRFALESHRRSLQARARGRWAAEVVPVEVPGKKEARLVDADEHPRADTDLGKLSGLKPAFTENGTVTAGNSSAISDGAAAVVLTAARGPKNAIRDGAVLLRDFASAGCPPELMGLGPVNAVRGLLAANGLSAGDVDLWEVNEAFAATSLAVNRELGLDPERVNVNGGAVALGHPIGASGARIVVTLIHEMKRRRAQRGVAALCIGGGMGMALLLENI